MTTPLHSSEWLDPIISGLVDWAESGRTKLGRPDSTLTPTEAKAKLQAALVEARIDEVTRMNNYMPSLTPCGNCVEISKRYSRRIKELDSTRKQTKEKII